MISSKKNLLYYHNDFKGLNLLFKFVSVDLNNSEILIFDVSIIFRFSELTIMRKLRKFDQTFGMELFTWEISQFNPIVDVNHEFN